MNTSASTLAETPISLDRILKKCGDLGRFQLIHYFFMNLISMSAAIMAYYYVFGAADINHRCRLPESVWPDDTYYYPINQTHEILINSYIPKTEDGTTWDNCKRY